MTIKFPCSQCGRSLQIGERFAGAKIRCPKCRAITAAPAGEPAAASAAAGQTKRPQRGLADTFDDIEPVKFRDNQTEEDDLDMTPMVDVTFLLLIFFMVTAAFSMQKSLEIPKPSEDNAVTQATIVDPNEGNIVIQIHSDSSVWINDAEAPSEQDLLVRLREAKAGVPGTDSTPINSVLVMAHEDSLHEVVVMVLDACNAVGMEKTKLATATDDDF